MSDTQRLSVIIPAYNAAEHIGATLESVLAQEPAPHEVIVVDDGSTDATPEVLAGWSDRVIVERIPNHGGPSKPRNVGLQRATGELAALFDADDLMLPGKLAAQAAALAAHPEPALCFTDFRVIDAAGALLADSFLADYRRFRADLEPTERPNVSRLPAEAFYAGLVRANFVGTSSVVARREVLLDLGGFDETLSNGDDIDLWFRAARAGVAGLFVDRPGHAYRKLEGGVTARGWRRLPAVIRIRERQRRHIDDPALLRDLDEAILGARLGYAWGLRGEGSLDDALREYRDANALRWTWTGFKGLLLCRLRQLLRR